MFNEAPNLQHIFILIARITSPFPYIWQSVHL